jgi:hypothetical protein
MFGYIKNVVFLAIVQGFEKKYEIFFIHYLRVLKLTKKCTKKQVSYGSYSRLSNLILNDLMIVRYL